MDRIYDQAKDQNVAALVIYAKANADGKAYSDKACTKQFKTSELKDAFIKRAVVCAGTNYFIPVSYAEASKIGSVNYVSTTGSNESLKTVLIKLAAVAD